MKGQKLNKKSSNGITLIALIITIVVLLILAIVTIGAVRDSGIIGHAQNAKNDYIIAQEKEQIMLGYSEYQISLLKNSSAQFKVDGASVTGDKTNGWVVEFESGNTYKVEPNGDIGEYVPEVPPGEDPIIPILTSYMTGDSTAVSQLKQYLEITDENVTEMKDMAFIDGSIPLTYVYKVDRLYKIDSNGAIVYAEETQNVDDYNFCRAVKEVKTELESYFIGKTKSDFEELSPTELDTTVKNNVSSNITSIHCAWSAGDIKVVSITYENGEKKIDSIGSLRINICLNNDTYYKVDIDSK